MKKCCKCSKTFLSDDWTCSTYGYKPAQLNGIIVHSPNFTKGEGGFKSEYFSQLVNLEGANFWFRARNQLIIWALKKYKSEAQNFLELGCGTGYVLSGIAEANPEMKLSGSEIFIDGLSYAFTRVPSAKFFQMDARKIPFSNEYDAIGAFDVLEHIKEDEVVLRQINTALKPDGVMLLTVPQHRWLWSASDEYACHVRRYDSSELDRKVCNAGFQILRSTSFVTLLLPAMIFSRNKQNNKKIFNSSDELKINPILNWLFYLIMSFECLGIRSGLNYFVGGSRLVIARKSN